MKLTKLFAGLSAAVLTAALAVAASAADPLVVWDFSQSDNTAFYNEDGTTAFEVNGATAAYDADNACLNVSVNSGDPYFILPNQGTFAAENCCVKVKYNLSGISDWSTSIYFTTDTVQWSEDGHWKGIYDGDDDEWCEQTFIMTECAAWAGTITDMRLDIFDSAYDGQVAKVAYVAVFGTEADANAFDYAAWQTNGRPTTLSADAAATTETAAEETAAAALPEAYPASGTEVPADSVLIAGELIGSELGWDGTAGSGRASAFDGNIETFFDPATASVDWCGIDAGEEMILTKIIIHPRTTYPDRFNGGTIEASNDPEFNDSVEIYYSPEGVAESSYLDVTADINADENTGYRYFRYINYMSHGDVAEVELYGKAVDGSNPTYGEAAEKETAVADTPEEYIVLTTVDNAEVIDDDTTQDLGGSGQAIQILPEYGCGYSSLGDIVVFKDVDFGENGAASAKMHFGYGANDGTVTTLAFYIDDPDGTPVLETEVGFTGGWDIAASGWVDLDLAIPAGTHSIYVKFTNEKSGSLSELTFMEAAPAPVEAAPAEETPAEEVIAEEAAVVEEEVVEEAAEEEAAETFDLGVIAAVAAIVSAAGYAISKKR